MKRKLLLMVSVLVVLSILVTGCGAQNNGGEEKIVHMNSSTEPGSLHPALAQGTHESIILDHVFEGLTKRVPDGSIVAGMAKDWKISDDGTVYTFTLRDGIKWSNGDPVVAGDFEYAWKYALKPATASDYAWQLYYLVGAAEYNSSEESDEAKLKELEDKVGVKALDDKTLEVTLTDPVPYFIELCAFYTYYPINKKLQEQNPDWANDGSTHVSNGPFKIVEWNHKENIVVKKNENYYNKKEVKLDGIDFALIEDLNTAWQKYLAGELDIDYDLPTDVLGMLREQNNAELIIGNELATYFYRFNTSKKPMSNIKIRKALTMAIDRQAIIDNVAQGGQTPAYAIVPGGISTDKGDFRQNGGNYFSENIEEAKKLLAEGLKEEGLDSLSFTIIYNTSEGHKMIAEAIQEMWRKNLGVDVTLENMEFQIKIEREHALDFEVSRAGWIGDYVDPMTFLDMWTSYSSQNDTGWTSEEFDALIDKAKTEFDMSKRMEYMNEAEKIFIESYAIMPIYFYTRPYVQKPYLTGVYKAANRDVNVVYADIVK